MCSEHASSVLVSLVSGEKKMERFSQRESLLLGYSPHRAAMNGGASASNASSHSNSDIDFRDVFGGPPRRSSVHEMRYRYSFSEVTDTSASKRDGGDDGDANDDDEVWAGFNEKPVFGEESTNRRRTHSDNFFDDIFRSNNSVTSSPRRLHLDPFSSPPGSRVLSPARQSSMGSSLPTQFSPPARFTKGVNPPMVSRATSLSRFSNQKIQSPEDLRNDIESFSRQSSVSWDFSHTGEGSSNFASSDKADTGGNLEKESKGSDNPTSISPLQFHFSIYRWASKGVPIAMPIKGCNASRVQKRTKNEEQTSTNETETRKSPKSTLPNVDDFPSIDHPLADATSSGLNCGKQERDLFRDKCNSHKVQPLKSMEEAIPPVVESETFSSIDYAVEDAPPQKEALVLMEQVHKPELKSTRSLFFDDDLQQGTDERAKSSRTESVVKGAKNSSVEAGSNKIAKNQKGKRSSLVKNIEVDKASLQGLPWNAGDNHGRSKVKGKVKDFVKMFNQEVLCKPPYDSELGGQSSKMKEKRAYKAENEASIRATKMNEDLQKPNVKNTFTDIPIMMNEALQQLEKEYSEAKTAAKPPALDFSTSITGSVTRDSNVVAGDGEECFQIKDFTEDGKKQPEAGSNHEELQAIDDKIRKWSRGKEGNIRSLLTTMQYVLWPESGWKTIPLVDIIEGNAVKRSYQRALLCLHPDKLQQKGAASHHKYAAAKVFDILQEAWDHFNSVGSL